MKRLVETSPKWVMAIFSVLLMFALIGAVAHAETFELTSEYYENLSDNPNPGVLLAPSLHYKFDPESTVSLEVPYESTDGWEDATLSFHRHITSHASTKFDVFLPTSLASQSDSMVVGGEISLRLQTSWDWFVVKLDNGLMAWDYNYATKATGDDYNSSFALSNKLLFDARIYGGLHANANVHLYTFQDFSGQTRNVYRDAFGLDWDVGENVTLSTYYSYKNGELNDILELERGHYQIHAGLTVRM